MAQRSFLPRARQAIWRAPWLAVCLLAGQLAHAASVTIEVHGVDEELRANVLAFLSFTRYQRGGVDLTPDVVERLHNRVEREVGQALRPFGFFEPTVDSTVTQQGPQDWRVVINIKTGPPVLVAHIDVRVDGPGENDPLFQRILRNLPLQVGDRLNQATYEAIKTDLQRTAATYGYLDARLIRNELVVDPPNHTANIALELASGERYRFGETTIEQQAVSDKLVRRYVRYRQGDFYDLTQVLRTQFALDDSQYFANLEVLPGDPDRKALTVPVNIRADPGRRHRYEVWGGYATDTGIRGTVTYQNRRLNSRGHSLSIQVQASQVQRYSVLARYRIPVLDPALENFSINGSAVQEDEADVTTYTESLGPSFTAVTGRWQHVWQLNGVRTTSENNAPTVQNPTQTRTDELIVPELDLATVPKGYLGEALFEHPFIAQFKASHGGLGARADFLQVHMQIERVFNIFPKWHLLVRNEFGATLVKDFNDLPVNYRFFAGGDNSVRGFAYNELSPLEGPTCFISPTTHQIIITASGSCQPVIGSYIKTGGKDLLTGTVEVIRELPRSLGVAAFFDYGNALDGFRRPECVPNTAGGTFCPPYIQYSVGIGLRVRLPVMTLGIDLAQPLSTSAGPRLHINFSPKL